MQGTTQIRTHSHLPGLDSRTRDCTAGRALAIALLAASQLFLTPAATALGPVEVPDTWGGDLLTRPRMSGDWSGVRDTLARHGAVVDIDVALTSRTVIDGGKDTGTLEWGNATYNVVLDTAKAGLWTGGFISVKGDSGFGNVGQRQLAAVVPANFATLLPAPLDTGSGLESATLTQFLAPSFGFIAGKIHTPDLALNEFYGNYKTQFMNTALTVPMGAALVPLSAFGGGMVWLPADGVTALALALDPNGTVMDNDIDEAFDGGVMLLAAINAKTSLWNLIGHHSVAGVWSDKTRLALEQDPGNIARALVTERYPRLGDPGPVLARIIERRFPGLATPVQPLARKDRTCMFNYSFDQYLWRSASTPERGLGVFFNFALTDGDPNPVQASYMLGIGGKGMVPGRPMDTFGIGWARTEFSDDFVPFLRKRLALGLDAEDAVELYYNAAVTPWLSISPSLQIVDSGFDKALDDNGSLQTLHTATVFFLRAYLRF